MKPFLLQSCCKDYIWGGNRLHEFGKASDTDRIAESWELSTHPDGESIIASGAYKGMTLTQYLNEHPEAAGSNCIQFSKFPVIVKLIDAYDRLSIQVHPDKTEMWYVVDAEPGASILYGFREEITKEQYRKAIGNGTLLDHMQKIPVSAGDVFMIPAGTLHAIGKGILIAEVQQNSNITYRVFDYNRGRELHIEQAVEVTEMKPSRNAPAEPTYKIPLSNSMYQRLGSCRYFSVSRFMLYGHLDFSPGTCYEHLLVLEGEGILTAGDEKLMLKKGSSVFIPAGTRYQIDGACTLIYTMTEQSK